MDERNILDHQFVVAAYTVTWVIQLGYLAFLGLTWRSEKRNAERIPEPFGNGAIDVGARNRGMFVVQKHAARRLHYDFRLQMEGVLRSWAVPRGAVAQPA